MNRLGLFLLLLVGIINALPVMGVASADVLSRLYGITAPDGDLLILMRHRALLFGVIGGLVIASVFNRLLQPAAMVCAAVSMAGFVVIAISAGDSGPKIQGVVWADVAGLICLAGAAFFYHKTPDQTPED